MKKFEGKAVFVTGKGKGKGYALCQAYAGEGTTVPLNDIDEALREELEKTVDEIEGMGVN